MNFITEKIVMDGLTFDDVLLVPAYSEVLPKDVCLKTQFSRNIELNVPFVTAVKPGACKIELPDQTMIHGHTDGGILTVSKDGVTLLAGQFSTEETK